MLTTKSIQISFRMYENTVTLVKFLLSATISHQVLSVHNNLQNSSRLTLDSSSSCSAISSSMLPSSIPPPSSSLTCSEIAVTTLSLAVSFVLAQSCSQFSDFSPDQAERLPRSNLGQELSQAKATFYPAHHFMGC